jgi:hypothetical protein
VTVTVRQLASEVTLRNTFGRKISIKGVSFDSTISREFRIDLVSSIKLKVPGALDPIPKEDLDATE